MFLTSKKDKRDVIVSLGNRSGRCRKGAVLYEKIVENKRKRKYKISQLDRLRYRTRYFKNAGIIGSKEFVAEVFD